MDSQYSIPNIHVKSANPPSDYIPQLGQGHWIELRSDQSHWKSWSQSLVQTNPFDIRGSLFFWPSQTQDIREFSVAKNHQKIKNSSSYARKKWPSTARLTPSSNGRVIVIAIVDGIVVNHAGLHHIGELLAVHTFDVPGHVHLLLGSVVAVRTLELRLLAALPLLMVTQRTFQLVVASAVRTLDTFRVLHVGGRAAWRERLVVGAATAATLDGRNAWIRSRPRFPVT